MNKTFAAVAVIALIGLGLPAPAHADLVTYVCDASAESAPPDWTGGPYSGAVRLIVDTLARSVELRDKDNRMLAATEPAGRLSALNNYKLDVNLTDNMVTWGLIEMWGFSGYLDRKTGRVDLLWTNSGGYSPSTLTRQFHGTCKERIGF